MLELDSVLPQGFAVPGSYFPYYAYPTFNPPAFDAVDTINVTILHNFLQPVMTLDCQNLGPIPGYQWSLAGGSTTHRGLVQVASQMVQLNQITKEYPVTCWFNTTDTNPSDVTSLLATLNTPQLFTITSVAGALATTYSATPRSNSSSSGSFQSSSSLSFGAGVGVGIAAALGFLIILCLVWCLLRRSYRKKHERSEMINSSHDQLSYHTLSYNTSAMSPQAMAVKHSELASITPAQELPTGMEVRGGEDTTFKLVHNLSSA